MERLGKYLILCLAVVVLIAILFIATSSDAKTNTKPPIPQFTVAIGEQSQLIPEKTSVDPFSGKSSTIPAYNVTTITVTLTVTNPPSTTAYLVGVKGHYATDWNEPKMDDPMSNGIMNVTALASSGSQTTIILNGTKDSQFHLGFSDNWGISAPLEGQIDFRLEAINGEVGSRVTGGTTYVGEPSGWSNIQTINLADGSISVAVSPTTTSTPSVPEFSWLAIIPLLVTIPSILILKKRLVGKLKQ